MLSLFLLPSFSSYPREHGEVHVPALGFWQVVPLQYVEDHLILSSRGLAVCCMARSWFMNLSSKDGRL